MDVPSDVSNGSIPCVLAVEDEPGTQELLSYLLKRRYKAVVVSSFDAARAEAEEQSFDVVLIDISLSDEHSGEDVLKALRAVDNTAAASMVACTAYAMPGDREHFLERGFDSYISKPFTRDRLYSVIDEAVEASAS